MDTDKFIDSLDSDEIDKIHNKLKLIVSKPHKNMVYRLELVNQHWLCLYEEDISKGLGTINLLKESTSSLTTYLDSFDYNSRLDVKLEEDFHVRQFIRVLKYFKNNGWEFGIGQSYGYNFIKIFDQG